MIECKNCSNFFESKYCPHCGAPAKVKRIDRHYVAHEVQHGVLHVEKGFLFTARELMLRPGHCIRNFIEGGRAKHYKPIGFVIVTSIIYTALGHYFDTSSVYPKPEGNANKVILWITTHYSYSNLIEILFISTTLTLLFWKKKYNYFEYIVLNCYLTGQAMLIGCIFMMASYFTKIPAIHALFPFFAIVYSIWGISQFFNDKKLLTYVKALLAYMLGFFLFFFIAILFAQLLTLLHIDL
jgi:hypothetical protein